METGSEVLYDRFTLSWLVSGESGFDSRSPQPSLDHSAGAQVTTWSSAAEYLGWVDSIWFDFFSSLPPRPSSPSLSLLPSLPFFLPSFPVIAKAYLLLVYFLCAHFWKGDFWKGKLYTPGKVSGACCLIVLPEGLQGRRLLETKVGVWGQQRLLGFKLSSWCFNSVPCAGRTTVTQGWPSLSKRTSWARKESWVMTIPPSRPWAGMAMKWAPSTCTQGRKWTQDSAWQGKRGC